MLAQIAAMTITVLTQSGEPDVLHGKVMQFIDELQTGAGINQPPPPMDLQFAELNGQEPPEALLLLQGLTWCGARGCSAFILDLSGTEARELGRFIAAATLEPLVSETNGWRDLSINGVPVTFRDGQYRSAASQ